MIVAQGAEAILKLENGFLVKERIPKNYRIKEIDDKIRRLRTRSETRLLQRASSVISVPLLINSDDKKMKITMEFINGLKLADYIDGINEKERGKIIRIIGNEVATLHNNNIIHGDLTTSNMILKDEKVFFIDFGLGFVSDKFEDKAVDIHLFRQALDSKHYTHSEKSFEYFLNGYKEKSKNFNEIIKRLEKVEKRGRYKEKS
ncbi:MAG: Kae1-associated serine/threonine protein kinase [Nanoarchaeota archaeon]|nr:Kae1-associated serine/threonine protein kinase [Nanoarchaeota archaeon]